MENEFGTFGCVAVLVDGQAGAALVGREPDDAVTGVGSIQSRGGGAAAREAGDVASAARTQRISTEWHERTERMRRKKRIEWGLHAERGAREGDVGRLRGRFEGSDRCTSDPR